MGIRVRGRRAVAAAAVLLAAASTFSAVAPAAASPIDTPAEPGPQNGTGPTGSGGPPLHCEGSKLVGPNGRIIANWTGACKDSKWTDQELGSTAKTCNTGMAVFRFYGTVANPTAGYSVSRITPETPNCFGGYRDWFRMYRNLPSDASPSGIDLAPLVTDWGKTAYMKDISGRHFDLVSDAGLLGGIGKVVTTSGDVDASHPGDSGYWGSVAGTAERFGGGCSTIASSNYWADYYQSVLNSTDPVYTPATRADRLRVIRVNLYQAVQAQKAQLSAEVTNPAERNLLSLQSVGVQRQYIPAAPSLGINSPIAGHDLRPVYNARGALIDVVGIVEDTPGHLADLPSLSATSTVDRFAEVFSTNPCYADANFYNQLTPDQIMAATSSTHPQPLTGADRSNFAVRGICYIPLYNTAIVNNIGVPSLYAASSYYHLGERFGDTYRGTVGTAGHENLTNDGATSLATFAGRQAPTSVLASYRAAMGGWYAAKATANAGPAWWATANSKANALFNGDWQSGAVQNLPAQPLDRNRNLIEWNASATDTGSGQYLDATAARDSLANDSRCELQPITVAPSFDEASRPSAPQLSFTTHLAVDAPGFMRAGGDMWSKNIIAARAATGPGLIGGVSCMVTATGGTLAAGDPCPASANIRGVTIKPTNPADRTIFSPAVTGFTAKEWWTSPQTGVSCTGLACVNPRFARASVDNRQTFTAAIKPSQVSTTVTYNYDAIVAPGFSMYDWDHKVLFTVPPVTTTKTATDTYTGLSNDPARKGSIAVPNPKAPVTRQADGGVTFTYKVWGSVNGGGGITGGVAGDGSDTMPGGVAGQ